MCIFSGDVKDVSETRIFARLSGTTQYLAYEMVFESSTEVAMVLPIPVQEPGLRNVVVFTDLSDYEEFFEDLDNCFPAETPDSWGLESSGLEVHSVGSFHASYVPSIPDFSELDDRFRLAPAIWKKLPAYVDYGFVVFQFKPGQQKPHPMAFSFPSAALDRIYFPTMHVHDSAVHSKAEFDHELYVQQIGRLSDHWELGNVRIAEGLRKSGVKISRAKGLVTPDEALYRTRVTGVHSNADIWV